MSIHLRWIGVLALAGVFLFVPGCSVGRNAGTGGIVWGVDMGVLAENTNQVVAQAVNQYLPGLGTLAGIVVPGVGAMGIGWARSHAAAVASKAAKEAEDRGWNDAVSHHSVPPVIAPAQPVVNTDPPDTAPPAQV